MGLIGLRGICSATKYSDDRKGATAPTSLLRHSFVREYVTSPPYPGTQLTVILAQKQSSQTVEKWVVWTSSCPSVVDAASPVEKKLIKLLWDIGVTGIKSRMSHLLPRLSMMSCPTSTTFSNNTSNSTNHKTDTGSIGARQRSAAMILQNSDHVYDY